MIYDLLFFFMVIIIVLNLIFGVIIDTFADLRSEKQKKEEILKTTCFICGKYLPQSGKQGTGQHGCACGHTAMGWAQTRPWAGTLTLFSPISALSWQTAEVSEASPAGEYLGS